VLLNVYRAKLPELTMHASSTASEALSLLCSRRFQLALVGSLGDRPAAVVDFLGGFRRLNIGVDIIVVAEKSSEDLAVAAIRCGAWDYLRGPVSSDDVSSTVNRW